MVLLINPQPLFAADAPRLDLRGRRSRGFCRQHAAGARAGGRLHRDDARQPLSGKHITFRNVAYSGDTVSGEARGLCTGWSTFESPQQGQNRLRKIIRELKPTVLIVNYGMNESFNGPEKLPDFVSGLKMLLDMLDRGRKRGGRPGRAAGAAALPQLSRRPRPRRCRIRRSTIATSSCIPTRSASWPQSADSLVRRSVFAYRRAGRRRTPDEQRDSSDVRGILAASRRRCRDALGLAVGQVAATTAADAASGRISRPTPAPCRPRSSAS